ncbi:hypothetical protein HaLaN_05866 [Haematococcus lacustris]|uniref:Uncharacterized protein n=1 Tax=Haematococcus lacustris TaxID=44745 RepID=A0A699YVL8_HAELA|nr:hypothetical protein HaLaN_05866 [Haematococcus lacustris]
MPTTQRTPTTQRMSSLVISSARCQDQPSIHHVKAVRRYGPCNERLLWTTQPCHIGKLSGPS